MTQNSFIWFISFHRHFSLVLLHWEALSSLKLIHYHAGQVRMCCSNNYPQSSVPNTTKCQFLLFLRRTPLWWQVFQGSSPLMGSLITKGSILLSSAFNIFFIITTAEKESISFFFFLISAVKQKWLVIHIYVFFFIFFYIIVYPRILNIVPVLYSRTSLLAVHSIRNSMQLPTLSL